MYKSNAHLQVLLQPFFSAEEIFYLDCKRACKFFVREKLFFKISSPFKKFLKRNRTIHDKRI